MSTEAVSNTNRESLLCHKYLGAYLALEITNEKRDAGFGSCFLVSNHVAGVRVTSFDDYGDTFYQKRSLFCASILRVQDK